MRINLAKYNQRVEEWARRSQAKMREAATAMAIQHRKDSPSPSASSKKIKSRIGKKDGIPSRVTFTFPRSLIWTHKGAGRGQGGTKGSRWINSFGNPRKTNPKSLGKMGTGSRVAKPWFNKTINDRSGVDELADIIVQESGDIIINNLFIR
jgi:hypothetical protein